MEERALRVSEVARVLGLHGTDAWELILSGELLAGKRDGRVVVPESALREYQERQAQASR